MDGQSASERASAPALSAARLPARLSVIVPTFNERENVPVLIERLRETLESLAWEVVFVDDDSTDGTLDALRAAATEDPRVRFIHRLGRRGLSSAVIEGVQSTNAPLIAVMDADLQHDEKLLPRMVEKFADPTLDLVVGTRYGEGGDVGDWNDKRQKMSRLATRVSKLVVKADLSDPMSGFFMMRREAFIASARNLSAQGYKILLDIVASSPRPLKIAELPFKFGLREHGESKLDTMVLWEYAALLLDKTIGRYVPARFVMFAIVGGAGVVVNLAVLAMLPKDTAQQFVTSNIIGVFVAMTFNFFVNNLLTYRDRRLRGFGGIALGLLSFYAVGMVGAVANVGIANVLFMRHYSWFVAAIAGILVGAVWNYAVSSIFTWRNK